MNVLRKGALSTLLTLAAIAATATDANASVSCGGFVPQAHTSIANAGTNVFDYEINVFGQDGCAVKTLDVVDFYLPYFSDMALSNIHQPLGWTSTIEATNDYFKLGGGVLHFRNISAAPSPFLTVGFDAGFAGTEGPFKQRLYSPDDGTFIIFTGDPLIPGSPETIAALTPVPEPESVAMLLAGLGIVGAMVRRKKSA